jgi:predicted nucleic acid-binding Zn ribbon protein
MMPQYEYECPQCGVVKVVSLSNHGLATKNMNLWCDMCDKVTRQKKIPSVANFSLKGDGWYKPAAKE